MSRTLEDLSYFTKSLIGMRPWKYDHSVHPIPWRGEIARQFADKKKFKVGVLRTDGVVDPSPACARALDEVAVALRKDGHEVVDVDPPSPYEALYLASQLLNSDGCKTFKSFFRTGEWEDRGARQMSWLMALPRPFKWVYYAWVKYVRRDEIWAGLIRDWSEKSCYEQWKLVTKREAYKAKFHDWWEQEAKIDFMITPPNATPAVPHEGMHDAVSSCGYTFLFNLVSDY
jgi:Asp-tRNA(Asn)/Glu-tRNA(Gln) amidotransferase A subunit family amidase